VTTETVETRPTSADLAAQLPALEAELAELLRLREGSAYDALSGSRRAQAALADAEQRYRDKAMAVERVTHALAGARAHEAAARAEAERRAVADAEAERGRLFAVRAALYQRIEQATAALAALCAEADTVNRDLAYVCVRLGDTAPGARHFHWMQDVRRFLLWTLAEAGKLDGGDWPYIRVGMRHGLVATAPLQASATGAEDQHPVSPVPASAEPENGRAKDGRFAGKPGPGRGHKATPHALSRAGAAP